jgi:hypothetical protein
MEVWFQAFLTSSLDGSERSALNVSTAFLPKAKILLVGAKSHSENRGEKSLASAGIQSLIHQLSASCLRHYIDGTIPGQFKAAENEKA